MKTYEEKLLNYIKGIMVNNISGNLLALSEDDKDFIEIAMDLIEKLYAIFSYDGLNLFFFHDFDTLCPVLELMRTNSDLTIKQIVEIIKTLLKNNLKCMVIKNKLYITDDLLKKFVEKGYSSFKSYSLEIYNQIAMEIENIITTKAKDKEYEEQINFIHKYSTLYFERDFELLKNLVGNNKIVYDFLCNKEASYFNFSLAAESLEFSKEIIDLMRIYHDNLEDKKEETVEVKNKTKIEVKKYDPNEYKNLRNQISEKYDTRLGRISEELDEEEIIELGIMIYKAYGEDELKKYFANVFESVISPISEYTKTMMMYEKIMYYQDKFQEKEIEDLRSYIEYIEEFGYEDCSKEFERTINRMKKMIPSSYSFEIERIKGRI